MRQGSFWSTTWLFVGVGPAVPATLVILYFLVSSGLSGMVIAYSPVGYVLAYLWGAPQAFAAGLACAALSSRIRRTSTWVVTCTILGAAAGSATAIVGLLEPYSQAAVGYFWMFGGCGAVAALACSVLTRNMRPRADRAVEREFA